MLRKISWIQVVFIFGVIALIIGILDPLEGSVIIATGSLLIALSSWLKNDRHKRIFISCFILIAIGISFLFYFSSLGGFGEGATLSCWWGILILPYPVGWLITVSLLIVRVLQKRKVALK